MALGYGRVATNQFGTAKFIVDTNGLSSGATHSTIAAALTSASSGDTIFIKPGIYTENLTLKAGVNLTALPGDPYTPNVTIVGKLTATFAGTASISNIRLQTNSDFFLSVTGSNATIIYVLNCYLNMVNNTGIQFTSSSSSSRVYCFNCNGDLGTTGIAIYSSSSAGSIIIRYSIIFNSGNSTVANTNSAGNATFAFVEIQNPITISGTGGFSAQHLAIFTPTTNSTCLTHGGSGAASARYCRFESGTAVAISVGAGASIATSVLVVNSNNATAAIDGAGTILYTGIAMIGTKTNITTATATAGTWI